ncbi:hypothetical protein V8D89_001736 [Ganoderma adspersum]
MAWLFSSVRAKLSIKNNLPLTCLCFRKVSDHVDPLDYDQVLAIFDEILDLDEYATRWPEDNLPLAREHHGRFEECTKVLGKRKRETKKGRAPDPGSGTNMDDESTDFKFYDDIGKEDRPVPAMPPTYDDPADVLIPSDYAHPFKTELSPLSHVYNAPHRDVSLIEACKVEALLDLVDSDSTNESTTTTSPNRLQLIRTMHAQSDVPSKIPNICLSLTFWESLSVDIKSPGVALVQQRELVFKAGKMGQAIGMGNWHWFSLFSLQAFLSPSRYLLPCPMKHLTYALASVMGWMDVEGTSLAKQPLGSAASATSFLHSRIKANLIVWQKYGFNLDLPPVPGALLVRTSKMMCAEVVPVAISLLSMIWPMRVLSQLSIGGLMATIDPWLLLAPPIPRYPAALSAAAVPIMQPLPPPSFEPSRPAIQRQNISISFQPVVSTKKDGKVSFLATLVHVLQDVLDILNVLWEKKTSKGLAWTDVSIRLLGNILPEGNTESETLSNFYDRHHSAQHRNGYFDKVPQELKHIKTPLINVVLFIDVAAHPSNTNHLWQWEDHTGMPSPTRTEKELLQWTKAQEKKHPGSLLVNSAANHSASFRVNLHPLAKLRVNNAGQFCLLWKDSEDSENMCEVTLADTFFTHRATKCVYKVKLTIDGSAQNCLAKRFFQIGQGEDHGTYFLKKFYETASQRGVEVFERFEFSHCTLAREVIDSENSASRPSPASGVLSDQWSNASFSDQDAGVVWLVEPEHWAVVEHWSGTMEHPNHHDKWGATLVAFVHFAYVYSPRTKIFADLQSIKKFLSDHMCNSMCQELGLRDTSDPLEDRDRILMRHDQDKYDTESKDEEEEETENHNQCHSACMLVSYESSQDDEEEGPSSA